MVLQGLEDKSGWVIAEACEVIFTLFDDKFPDVVKSLGMLEKLARFGNYLSQKVEYNLRALVTDFFLDSHLYYR